MKYNFYVLKNETVGWYVAEKRGEIESINTSI